MVKNFMKLNQTWYGVFPVYLECKAKRIFDVAGIGAEVMCFKCCLVFFLKIINIDLKMGGTPFERQDFSVLSPPPPLVFSPVFSSRILSLVSRVLSLASSSSRVLSRCLARLSRCLARLSRCLARLSIRSFGLSLWCVFMMYDLFMLTLVFLNECQKKVKKSY